MSMSTRETGLNESSTLDDVSVIDLWALTSDEGSSSAEEDENEADDLLLDVGVIQATDTIWQDRVHRDITEYPQLKPSENYQQYYARIARKFNLNKHDTGEFNLDSETVDYRFKALIKAVERDFEKLAEKLIKIIPSALLDVDKCEELFKAIGVRSKKRTNIVTLLLPLISAFTDEDRHKIIVKGCLSFVNKKNKNQLHAVEVFSLLWMHLSVEQQRQFSINNVDDLDGDPAAQEFGRLLFRMDSLLSLGGVLTGIQCVLDSYPNDKRDEYIDDALFLAPFHGLYSVDIFRAKTANAVSLLMNTYSPEKRCSLAMQILNLAITFYDHGVVRLAEAPNLPIGFKKYLDTLVKEEAPERVAGMVLYDPEDSSGEEEEDAKLHVIAKAFYSIIVAFSAKDLIEKITLLSFLSAEHLKKVIETCVAFSVGGGVEIDKIQFLLNLLPASDRVHMLTSLIWNALNKAFANPEEKLQRLFRTAENMGILMPVVKLFLQMKEAERYGRPAPEKRLKKIQAVFNQFPAIDWQQAMKEIVEEKLDAPDSDPSLSEVLTAYKSDSRMGNALALVLTAAAIVENDEKANVLLSKMPEDSFLQPALIYLDKRIQLIEDNKAIFKSFHKSFVSHHNSVDLIYGMADYDRQHDTHLLKSFFDAYRYRDDILVKVLRKTNAVKGLQAIVWNAIKEDHKLDVLNSAIVDCYWYSDIVESAYSQCVEPLFKTLSKESRDSVLVKAVRSIAELPVAEGSLFSILNGINILSKFYLQQLGLSPKEFVNISARALIWFLKGEWELYPAQNLLMSLSRTADTKRYVNLILLKALHTAVLGRESQLIVALLNLPVAWKLVEKSEMDELLTRLKETSPLDEEQKMFLADSISPTKRVVKPAPSIATVAPRQAGLFKPQPDKNLIFAKDSLAFGLRQVCVEYRADRVVAKNSHDALASLVIACIDKLPEYAARTNNSDVFQLTTLKIILLSLIRNFEDRHSKNFMKRIETLKSTHVGFLLDLKGFETDHKNQIQFAVSIFKAHKDQSSENNEADKILSQLVLSLQSELFTTPQNRQ